MSKQIITKRCSVCKQIKLLTEFHKSSTGKCKRQTMCKQCNKEYLRRYMKKYHKTDKGKEITKRYTHSEKGLEISRQAYKRHRVKKIASACVRNRIKYGMIPHPTTMKCNICKSQATEYHHHKGYDRKNRYNVIPICSICHSLVHRKKVS